MEGSANRLRVCPYSTSVHPNAGNGFRLGVQRIPRRELMSQTGRIVKSLGFSFGPDRLRLESGPFLRPRTGPCLIEVVVLSTHVSDSTVLVWHTAQKEKGRVPESAERRGEE